MKTIEIGYAFKEKPEVDFGRLNKDYRKGTIKVDLAFWTDYCNKRYEFEIMHDELVKKMEKR